MEWRWVVGYDKIRNLEARSEILLFKEVYATEKVHGTSAHITFRKSDIGVWSISHIFSGGIKHPTFVEMINERFPNLLEKFTTYIADWPEVSSITFYGEGYGGSCQRMGDIYGPLNFIVFEVLVGDKWMDVPTAAKIAQAVGLPFVPWERGPSSIEWLEAQRDQPSRLAALNGMGEKFGEGIVIRPPFECTKNDGGRPRAKFKREEFRETATARPLTTEQVKLLDDANEVASEYAVMERLRHVVDKLAAAGVELSIENTNRVIAAMVDDIKAEATDVVWGKETARAIGKVAAKLYHRWLNEEYHAS